MAKQVIYRRGTTAEHADFVGANGEITVDTVKHVVVVHDGVTAGGFPVLTTALLTSSLASLNSNVISHTASITSLNANAVAQATLLNTLSANAAAQQTSINDFILASNATALFANIAGVQANVTAANVQIGLLFGNATVQSEAIVRANANIIALQSGLTAANVAIAGFVAGSGFANVNQLTANITAVNSAISTQGTTFATNVAVAALRANVTAANVAISSLQAGLTAANVLIDNIALSPALIAEVTQSVTDANVAMNSRVSDLTSSLDANITAANLVIITANSGMKSYVDAVTTAWISNALTQQTAINSLRANVTAANSLAQSLSANVGSFYSYANTTYGTSNLSNAQVASYLASSSGTIGASAIKNLTSINLTGDRTKYDPLAIVANPVTVTGNIEFNDNFPNATSNAAIGISSRLRVSGRLQVLGDITIPNESNFNETYNIGNSATSRYNNVWTKTVNAETLNVGTSINAGLGVPLTVGLITSGDVVPGSTATYNIGSSLKRWLSVNATSYIGDNYRYANGVSILASITPNSGPVFMANVYLSGQNLPTSPGTISEVTLVYNNVIKNVGTGYSNSTGIFTAPVTGYYQVSASIGVSPLYWDDVGLYYSQGAIGLYKNNSPIASGPLIDFRGVLGPGGIVTQVITSSSVSTLVYLTSGETLSTKLAYSTTAPQGFWVTITNIVPGYFNAIWTRGA